MKARYSPIRRLPSRRAGASTVEMAMIAPILILLVFGVMQFAMGYMVHHLIQDAARQGCRVAIGYGKSNTDVLSKINTLLAAENVTGATTTIQVNSASANVASAASGDEITVVITVPASTITFFPNSLTGRLSAQCTMIHN